MTIVGFNFTKIDVERKNASKGKINISNNVAIKDIDEGSFSLGVESQKGLRFTFEFFSRYEPDYATIHLSGEILYMADEKEVKKILDDWKKESKIENSLMSLILNNILNKCNVQAVILSQTMNLPSPIPLPKVSNQAPGKATMNEAKKE
jgi:hypothetical protein